MRLLLTLSMLCFFLACGDDEIAEPVDFSADYAYFPLELNKQYIYDLDSIVLFNTVQGIVYDTARSQVREELVEAFESGDGVTQYRGERWQRHDASSPWTFVQSYTLERTETAARRTEDNLTFTKLTFPIRPGDTWDGNVAFNPRTEVVVGGEFLDVYNNWRYQYGEGSGNLTTAGQAMLEDVWTVDQADVDNLIDLRSAFERYAPGIGLVERFIDARHTQCRQCCNGDTQQCSDLPWDEKAEKGFILHQLFREVL